jgi:hypothetical protein
MYREFTPNRIKIRYKVTKVANSTTHYDYFFPLRIGVDIFKSQQKKCFGLSHSHCVLG